MDRLNFSGEFTLPWTIPEVYDFLTDPGRIVKCLPDIRSYQIHDGQHFDATVLVGFSRVRGPMSMKVEIVEKRPTSYARLLAKSKLLNSSVNVDGIFTVSAAGDGATLVGWSASARIGVVLANIVGPMVDGLVQEKVEQFICAVREEMQARPVAG